MNGLLRRLRCAGGTGADLSPGDQLCAEAADEIERLEDKLFEYERGIVECGWAIRAVEAEAKVKQLESELESALNDDRGIL